MLLAEHDSTLHEVPSDGEQNCQVYPRGGSGQEICVQCMMGSDTLLGEGGDTLVSCRDSGGGRGEIESEENEVIVHYGTG